MDSLKNPQAVKEFCEARDWDQFHSPKELAIGISNEANELLVFSTLNQKKKWRRC